MTDFLIILVAIIVFLLIILIFLYNRLDRKRFYLDRNLKKNRDALDQWVRACDKISPGSGTEYFSAKKNHEKLACIEKLVRSVQKDSEEKLEIQESLLDFGAYFNELAAGYNHTLENSPLRKIYAFLGFKRYPPIEFYPDLKWQDARGTVQI